MHISRRATAPKLSLGIALFTALVLAPPLLAQTSSSTLDRVRSTGKLTLGYYPDASPLSYRNAAGNADGYAPALCRGIAAIVKAELGQPDLSVQFIPLDAGHVAALKDGRIDLLCAPVQPTLSRRADVSFSIPVFPGGTGVLMRKDTSQNFRDLLEGLTTDDKPLWRGKPQLHVLNERKFAVVAGSSSEQWVKTRKQELGVNSAIVPVPDPKSGLRMVLDREVDALLGDRSVLLELANRDPSARDLVVGNRRFNHAMLALAMRRGDEDFRLLVDKTLSRLYRYGKIGAIYEQHLGKPDAATREWFQLVAERE